MYAHRISSILCLAVTTVSWGGDEYSHRIWRTQDGLPQSAVVAFAQTSDGYLWIGTPGGLARFDGVRFTVFDRSNTKAFRDDSILSLLAEKDRTLWIGTQGGGLLRWDGRNFQTYGAAEGLSNLFVRALHRDRAGTLWVGTDRGFFRWDDAGRLTRVDGSPDVPVASVRALAEAADGSLWLGGPAGILVWRGGKLSNVPFRGSVYAIRTMHDGAMWFATADGLRVMKPGSRELSRPPLRQADADALFQGGNGDLWIGTMGSGLLRLRGGQTRVYNEEDFLPDNSVLTIFEDREQNLWVGTQDGLLRMNPSVLSLLTTRNGLASNHLSTIYQDRGGTLWMTTVTGGVYRLQGERVQAYQPAPRSGPIRAHNVYRDHEGALWMGTLSQGVARIWDRKAKFFTRSDGLRNEQVREFSEDSQGNLWWATGSGLVRWSGGRIQTTYYLEEGLAYGSVRTVLELRRGPRRGDLLIGTDGGLNRMHDLKIVQDASLAPLSGEKIWTILEDSAGTVWLGTRGGGLFRLKDDRAVRLGTADGLLSNSIYQILDDGLGRLWMSTPAGIFSARRSDLDAAADGKPGLISIVPYGSSDGLESVEMKGGFQSAGCRTTAGELWFPGVKGAVRIDPRQLRISQAPGVTIESVSVDGVAMAPRQEARVAAGRAKVEIAFTACNLRSPERLTFQYKLEGFDKDWSAPSKARVAYYTNLSPNQYRFRALARDATTEESPSETSLSITWEPRYFQTLWFRVLCFGLSGLAVAGALRMYARQTKSRYALLLAERTRLAREMHDTVIQGCVGVSTLLEAAGSLEAADRRGARSLVEQARAQIRDTIEEARQAVWDLRHASNEGSLAANLETFARELSDGKRVAVEFRSSGDAKGLEQGADRNLLLVAREAIRNAVAHGQPRRVQVVLSFEPAAVRLEISDDGEGFEPDAARGPEHGHFGILGMRERVEQLGGSFRLTSKPGEGAQVVVLVPHYARSHS